MAGEEGNFHTFYSCIFLKCDIKYCINRQGKLLSIVQFTFTFFHVRVIFFCFCFLQFSVFADADGQSIEQSRTSPSLYTHREKCLDRN